MPPLLHDAPVDTVALSFEQTVPRAWVHKRSLDNVLLTEIRACGTDRFICAGRLPTAHCFFNDAGRTPHSDILFYTELGRQASLAMCHAFLGVSAEDVFIFEGSDAVVTDAAWQEVADSSWTTVTIEIRIPEVTRRKNNAISRVVTEHTMWVGTQRVFHGTGAFTIQPAALFQRLRRGSAAHTTTSPQAAHGSGTAARAARAPHASVTNTAISTPRRTDTAGEFSAALVVDHTHPYFFDHPCDHVPGMVLLEGCAQLALAAFAETAGLESAGIAGYDVSFTQFVEPGFETTLTAQVDTAQDAGDAERLPVVRLSISQRGALCGAAIIHLARPAGH